MFNFELKGAKASVKATAITKLTEQKLLGEAAFVGAEIDSIPAEINFISLAVTTRGTTDKEAGKFISNIQVRIQKLDMLQ